MWNFGDFSRGGGGRDEEDFFLVGKHRSLGYALPSRPRIWRWASMPPLWSFSLGSDFNLVGPDFFRGSVSIVEVLRPPLFQL